MNMNKKQTGKQIFDRTPYIRELFIGSDGIAKVKTPDGTRVLTSEDISGLNNALLAKFNAVGTEKAAQDYAKAIDQGPWPITVGAGDVPEWALEFTEFLETINLSLTKVTGSNRLWKISTPNNGYFGGKLARTIADYMLANNLLGNATRKIIDELDADLVVEWEVYKSSSSTK